MKWEVGDVATYIGEEIKPYIGLEVEITALAPHPGIPEDRDCAVRNPVDLSPHSEGAWLALQKDLKPLEDPMQKTSWDDCIFKPSEPVYVTTQSPERIEDTTET